MVNGNKIQRIPIYEDDDDEEEEEEEGDPMTKYYVLLLKLSTMNINTWFNHYKEQNDPIQTFGKRNLISKAELYTNYIVSTILHGLIYLIQ